MEYLKCDRCSAEYRDQESIDTAKKGEEDWKKMCEKDGVKARGLFPCPALLCPGEMVLMNDDWPVVACPHCGKTTDYLRMEETHWMAVSVMLATNGKIEYNDVCDGDSSITEFQCPECDWIIATDEEEAIRFLKGEIVSEQEEKRPEEG